MTAVSPGQALPGETLAAAPFLRARERRTVAAFAEVLFSSAERPLLAPEGVAGRVDAQLQLMRESKRTRSLHIILLVVEYVLPLAGVGVLGIHLRPCSRAARNR